MNFHHYNKRPLRALIASIILSSLSSIELSAQESQDSASSISEINVVGQKIERSLQDTKESIAVITSETIEARNLVDLEDVLNQTAGVTGAGTFSVRGISSGQIGTLRSELASFYVDGVALSGWAKSEGPQQMWDVQQVEVMRGPQSTNLGRNALAGAIVVATMDPVYENQGSIRAGLGNFGHQEIKAMGNVSLSDGVAALRMTYENSESDGYINNLTRGEDDFNYSDRENLRLKLLLEPSEDLSMVLSLQYTENGHGDSTQAFEDAGYPREDRVALADVAGIYNLEGIIASLSADYTINDSWSFKSITASQDSERERQDDFDNLAFDLSTGGGIVIREGEDKNFSQELRFNFDNGNVRGSSGIYYSTIDADNRNDTQAALSLEPLINGFSSGLGTTLVGFGVYPALYDVLTGGVTSLETTNKAIFTEWEFTLSENLLLSVGARYDQEKQNISYVSTGSSSVVLPDPADWAILGPAGQGAIGLINTQLAALSTDGTLSTPNSDFNAFLPKVGITYNLSNDISVSLFGNRGYRSGSTEVTGLGTNNPYDPEYLDNIELTFRSVILDGRGIFNANLYRGKWKDQQVSVPEIAGSNAFTIIENAGESEISGFETEFQFQASDSFSLFATLGYNKTEFIDFISGTADFSGNEFVAAPKINGAFGGHYRSSNGAFIGANLSYEDSSFADHANTLILESRTRININAGYETDDYKVEVYVNNFLDDDYATAIFQDFGRMGAPRHSGARFTYNF